LERVELWFTLQSEGKPITIDKISLVRSRLKLEQLLEELSEIPIKSEDEPLKIAHFLKDRISE
jgi:hypothetical protein